ncbi:polysaccharide deacetylase family protein [Caldimonas thermodepolymerans]|jgi:Predicted deacetylase|uniref:DUF2334 domain-containing protein n=1 Tax=Caldimonas thermodepolymerans TaxID=215580 RepID=A0A2S5T479_9BURK|nr:polysaccharide deacetylase family protein [Caldimonas thermodepolymerans]PPE69790.1 DUF2334 domain-containing protein [Caldimonas thermodepolymerans]QPC32623.1 polysaccharide deacetylase family protein [Caldimonas thermodepolymerans]RDI03375.1 hypothetical protein DES46_10155 [Caldimonas thermodepolymerans]TCP06766.1 hypothetical protein EV676_106251 [Caldimonas thermodepolymerans]UZG45429.1 polysaccharide deacetylase family protein [Caldimonas thermodepolymerans]
MDPRLCIVLHDVAPTTWAACCRVLDAVGELTPGPLTLLAVPRHHGAPRSLAFDTQLTVRLEAGDELALHGYTHRDDGRPLGPVDWLMRRCYTAGEGEFAALGHEAALQRLVAGARWFQANGWPLHGFVAPAWLLGRGAWSALRAMPLLRYTATLRHLHALPQGPALAAPSVVYSTRAAWRRATSVAWNAWQGRWMQQALLVRFELHPHDADHAAVRRSWQQLLARELAYRRVVTVAGFVDAWLDGLRPAAAGVPGGGAGAGQNSASTPNAINAPMPAPASTSLG